MDSENISKEINKFKNIKSDYFYKNYFFIYQERYHLKFLNVIKIFKKE